MNLIEQLGGYEKAQEKFSWMESCREYSINQVNLSMLRAELLEHRRANSIFELNDKIIRLDHDSSHIYTIQRIDKDLFTIVRKKKANSVKVWGTWLGADQIRHATDEEIKAGHRL